MAGQPWGYEAVLPSGFDFALAAPDAARTLFEWLELGVQPPAGRRFAPVAGTLRLILPAGAKGPAFLVSRNFRAILRYNSATSYALAVGHLADRIVGGPELASAWPPGDRGLDRSEREEVQQRLLAIGIDAGQVDGLIGSQTRSAIRTFQQQRGLPADGHPGPNLLEALRRADRS
jgi:membrane-bound lytic murein transglycosylase B